MKNFTIIFLSIFFTWTCSGKADEMNKINMNQNRLANSQSPYLLQHASNPVDWYPWGEEAFNKAKKENKPIFLSIGYSTCHWCHVMEHESFEDSTVAALMNENFISVKVDREEMPEVDHLYMSVCQAMTGRGGWPLTIIMTPEKEPFFAGTYFPKNGRGKRPGMMQLLPGLANAWNTKQDEIQKSIDRVQSYLVKVNTGTQGNAWDESMVRNAFTQFANRFDPDFGGFGKAPKFPSSHNLIFLLRYGKIFNDKTSRKMVETTLHHMRLGGIFDHIGLGFHRYSTDKRWFLPHFEKMLYDQAMISMAYLESYQLTGNENYADVAREIFSYVLRDMRDTKGGFFSAEDADSEGEEGLFYVWTEEELIEILGTDNGMKLAKIYGFSETGNFHEESSGRFTGNNIPYFPHDKSELAKKVGMDLESFDELITSTRKKLFEVREKRIHPLKDDKILTDWNGLMIAALALGGQVLKEPSYINAAKHSAEFIENSLRDKKGRLMKRHRLGQSGLAPHLDDYSFMVWGLLNLYEATFEPNYLSSAIELTDIMIEDFSDENGGFYIGSKDAEKLMVRAKDSYDGAIPSGNSVAAMNLFRLSKITGNIHWVEMAEKTLKSFTEKAEKSPSGFSHMMTAFMFNDKNPKEIVVVGDGNLDGTQEILNTINSLYLPNRIILFKDISKSKSLETIAPWTKDHVSLNGKPTIYICENFACKQPTTNLNTALKILNQ